ncbi:hypothetical protein CLV81_0858 [Flagellimonas meridianipacifica]|uniref:Uncharacterized protein n=1 Tax=Flagellimonas meridianipacifica TaxID=1080225 RepID=A0A2T0MH07_9FLAO|nr:hypothetical protein CLV81_0858 [Allomuricauda pacifica]
MIGLLLALHSFFISGTNPLFELLIKGFLLLLIVYCVSQILKEPSKREKLIQTLILLLSIGFGLFVANRSLDKLNKTGGRKYQVEQKSN